MNDFGKIFKVNIFGTSHGENIGVLIDGIPTGLKVLKSDFDSDLARRKPGYVGSTERKESDEPIISSGLFNDYTNGTPMLIMFKNEDQHSCDYEKLLSQPRPGHADFVSKVKYNGFADYRGGGAFSGRLTAGIVAAGVVAKKIANYEYSSEIISLGDLKDLTKKDEYLQQIKDQNDSVGGVIRITVKGLPAGLGEPYFYSVESAISQILYSIGGVKGVSFGDGFSGASLKGSEFNDPIIDSFGHTSSNHNGGVNGGITNGNDLIVNVFVKPTSSISKTQDTFDFAKKEINKLEIGGRHDASIVERCLVVLEASVAIALADLTILEKINK